MHHGGRAGLRELLPPPPPSLSRLTVRVPAAEGARTGGGGGLCSLLLSLLSDPSGSSDSLHSGSPSVTPRLHSLSLSLPLSLSLCLLSVSVSRPPLRLSPPRSLVWFLSTGASRGPAGSKVLPYPPRLLQPPDGRVRTCLPACSPVAAAWTRVSSPPPPLLLLLLLPPPPRRGRPRPDTLPPAKIKNAPKKAPHDEDCSVSGSSRSAGSLLLLLPSLLLLLLGDFLGFLERL